MKNHKIAKNTTITKAREQIRIDLESLEFKTFFTYVGLKLKTNKFY